MEQNPWLNQSQLEYINVNLPEGMQLGIKELVRRYFTTARVSLDHLYIGIRPPHYAVPAQLRELVKHVYNEVEPATLDKAIESLVAGYIALKEL